MRVAKQVTNRTDKKSDRSDPWTTALRLLTGRDYSLIELRQRLIARAYEPDKVEATLQRCLDLGYLDDNRYAASRARSLMSQGRAVGRRILMDLKQRGISDEIALEALEQARQECSDEQLLQSLVARRFPDFDYNSAPAKERRRVIHFLQRRGFTLDGIMKQLKQKGFETHHDNR